MAKQLNLMIEIQMVEVSTMVANLHLKTVLRQFWVQFIWMVDLNRRNTIMRLMGNTFGGLDSAQILINAKEGCKWLEKTGSKT